MPIPRQSVSCRFTEEALTALDEAAKESGQDRSGYIRQAVNEKLHRTRDVDAVVKSLQTVTHELKGIRSRQNLTWEALTDLIRQLVPGREKEFRERIVEAYQNGLATAAKEQEDR